MFLSGYEVRAVTDDKQFAVLSSSRPFGSGSPKVRTTSARTGAMYSCSGRKKISSATPADFSSAIADRTTSWLMSRHADRDDVVPKSASGKSVAVVTIPNS